MSVPERRIDPSDGMAYTFSDIFGFYRRMYAPWQIEEYWRMMEPFSAGPPPPPPDYRFDQGDRVLCNVGDRRLAGTVLNKDVEDPDDPNDKLAYVVKTDAIAGVLESRTISAPSDCDEVICRERCFNAQSEVSLAKWAAPMVSETERKPLRFDLDAPVSIRIQDGDDGCEQWATGRVIEVWPALPGKKKKGFLKTADAVPYKVVAETKKGPGNFYCHRDEHTLIRRPENVPRTPGRGVSKRFELRKLPDGRVEKFDHVTLRGRIESNIEEESTDAESSGDESS